MAMPSQTLGQQVQDTSKQVQEQVQTKAPAAIAYMCCQQEAVHSQSQCQGFCVVCLLASCLSISAGSCSSARTSWREGDFQEICTWRGLQQKSIMRTVVAINGCMHTYALYGGLCMFVDHPRVICVILSCVCGPLLAASAHWYACETLSPADIVFQMYFNICQYFGIYLVFSVCWCPILRMDIYSVWAVAVFTTRKICVSLYTCTPSTGTWRKTQD